MMKQSGVFKKLFFGFAIFFAFLTQGWGACSGTAIATWDTSSATTYQSASDTVTSAQADLYTITASRNGILTITVNNTDAGSDDIEDVYLYDDDSCTNRIWDAGRISQQSSDSITVTVSSTPKTYKLYLIGRQASTATYNVSGTFAVAPTLSAVSVNSVGATTATLNATPSVSGTMYYVVTTSATSPTVAQVKAGQTNTGSAAPFKGNAAVTESIAKSFDLTGLTTGTTYYGYLVMTNSSGTNTVSVYPTGSFKPTLAPNVRSFTVAHSENNFGDIKIIGNSVMVGGLNNVCPADNARNNYVDTFYANIDSANTYNSSSATLSIPAGATVKWAGLYWQGYGTDYNSTMKQVKFKAPNMSSYQSLTSSTSKFNWVYFGTGRYYYQGAVDITGYVKAGGSGDYVVGDIATRLGKEPAVPGGSFGAWSIVVVYEDMVGASLKNLTVFDGYQAISSGDSGNPGVYTTLPITLGGFLTPKSGSVSSTFYMFAGEGDIGSAGDPVTLTNKAGAAINITDTLNPSNDIMNSSITNNGNYVTARSPNCKNTIGIDIDNFAVGTTTGALGIIGNNQTSTTATFTSSGDGFFPGMAAFATQIYQPVINLVKTADTSGSLKPNDTISYRADIKNIGQEGASNITVYDDFTTNILKKSNGDDTNPAIYLSDVIDRNATKIFNSIRLTGVNGSLPGTHCPVGSTGSGCTAFDADCKVEHSGSNPETTATKLSCNIPNLAINDTVIMTFSLSIGADAIAATQGQDVNVTNVMEATYYNALTGELVPGTASSNAASAGLVKGVPTLEFNAWETSYQSYALPKIYTKIAAADKQFTLSVGASSVFTGGVCAAVIDSGGTILTGGGYQCQDFTGVTDKQFGWTVTQANKMAKIHIRSKRDTVTGGVVPSDWTDWSSIDSSDKFAIRPQYLSVSTTPSPLIVQKAGDNTNKIDINTTTPGYDQSLTNLTLNISKWLKIDGSDLGSTPPVVTGLTLSGSFNSATGNASDATFVFSDVGRFKLDVNDMQWAADSKDIENEDCLKNSANYASANDLIGGKYGCYVMLNPQSSVDLRFIPDHFNVTGGVITNANSGFTYFSNDLAAQAATIPMTITAVNKTGVATQNYSNGLYAQTVTSMPTVSASGYAEVHDLPSSNFANGIKDMTGSNAFKFNFQRATNTPLSPLTISDANVTNLNITDTDGVAGTLTVSGSAVFLYGKVSMPNAMVDYNNTVPPTVRAFAQVYAAQLTDLPGSGWINALGSTTWWINKLDTTNHLDGTDKVMPMLSSALGTNNTGIAASVLNMSSGIANISLNMSGAKNKDQKLKIHLAVPSYLWYSPTGVTYDFAAGSDCSRHPCAWVDVFATTTSDWFGAGEKKGDKAIKAVPKGKRKPKVNW